MIIEMQRFRVRPDMRQDWLEADQEIWTEGLAREAGFLGKEVWLGEGDEVVLVIRWNSRVEWEAVAGKRQEHRDQDFRRRMGKGWEPVETRAYELAEAIQAVPHPLRP